MLIKVTEFSPNTLWPNSHMAAMLKICAGKIHSGYDFTYLTHVLWICSMQKYEHAAAFLIWIFTMVSKARVKFDVNPQDNLQVTYEDFETDLLQCKICTTCGPDI